MRLGITRVQLFQETLGITNKNNNWTQLFFLESLYTSKDLTPEIVKWGFWCKLPLLPLLWHANAIDEISNFPFYSFTNDLLSQFIYFGIMNKSQLHALAPHWIFHRPHNSLQYPQFDMWFSFPMVSHSKVHSYKIFSRSM